MDCSYEKQQTETIDGGRTVGEKPGMDHGGGVTIYIYIDMFNVLY